MLFLLLQQVYRAISDKNANVSDDNIKNFMQGAPSHSWTATIILLLNAVATWATFYNYVCYSWVILSL